MPVDDKDWRITYKGLKEQYKELKNKLEEKTKNAEYWCDEYHRENKTITNLQNAIEKLSVENSELNEKLSSQQCQMVATMEDIIMALIIKQDPRLERRKQDIKANRVMGIRRPY